MEDWQRRTLLYVGTVFGAIAVFSVPYHYGMILLEGDEGRQFVQSVQVVVETFTATGYGSDSPWETTAMNLLVIVMDITGVALVFLALPVFAFPLLQDALSTTVPTRLEEATDHVVICTYTARAESLIDALTVRDVDYVLVEPDRERARELYESGYRVIAADPESADGLEAARVADARALVADVSDEVDTSIVLAA
ncbi:metal transporter, partial [Halobacteriales archaeon QS_9_70_65]